MFPSPLHSSSDFRQHPLSGSRQDCGSRSRSDTDDTGNLFHAFLLHLSQVQHLVLRGWQFEQFLLQPHIILLRFHHHVGRRLVAFWLKMRMQQQGIFPLFAVPVDTEVFGDASSQTFGMLCRGDVLSDGSQPEHGVLRHVFGSHAVGVTAPADVQGCLPQLGNQ